MSLIVHEENLNKSVHVRDKAESEHWKLVITVPLRPHCIENGHNSMKNMITAVWKTLWNHCQQRQL